MFHLRRTVALSLVHCAVPQRAVASSFSAAHPQLRRLQHDVASTRSPLATDLPSFSSPPSASSSTTSAPEDQVHLGKLIARSGMMSRRGALELLSSGRVAVDGVTLDAKSNYSVKRTAKITIDGKPFLQQQTKQTMQADANGTAVSSSNLHVPTHMPPPRVWLYYKPSGLVVSHKDERGRPTVFERIQQDHPNIVSGAKTGRLLSVGRLDFLSEGLLLLTNNGGVQRFLEMPSSELTRTYRIKIRGRLTEEQMASLEAGLDIDGFRFKPAKIIHLYSTPQQGSWYEIVVTEGKNREIRTLMNYFNFNVITLVRVAFHQWKIETEHGTSANSNVNTKQPKPKSSSSSSSYTLQPGDIVEVKWTPALEKQRLNWVKTFENTKQQRELGSGPKPSNISSSHLTSNSAISSSAGAVRSFHMVARSHSFLSSFIPRRFMSSIVSSSSSSAASFATPASSSSTPSSITKKKSRVYPEQTGFYIVPEKSDKSTKSDSNTNISKDKSKRPKASLQKGAPPPRVVIPPPQCLRGIDRPWMWDELELKFEAVEYSPEFTLKIHQWTGMNYDADDVVADEDSGSGAIVWDAGLHLAHYLRSHRFHASPKGATLEIGAGTGVLGLAMEKILTHQASAGQKMILADEGPVLKLLQKNVDANSSRARVLPFAWHRVDEFLATLETELMTKHQLTSIICSELLDTIPSSANLNRPFSVDSLDTLVNALTKVAQWGIKQQRAASPTAPTAVHLYFAFEQRGALNLRRDGLLQTHLLDAMETKGWSISRTRGGVYSDARYDDLVILEGRYTGEQQ